jgi:Ca2+-binding EF-hand superfamily protein
MLEALGHTMSNEDLRDLVERIDTDKDGKLQTSELAAWLASPEFQSLPLSYSLMAFLADGRAGLQNLVNDITDVTSTRAKGTDAVR